MGNTFYVCPLCGQEFRLKSRQKNVKCGNHILRVAEDKGLLTVQVIPPKSSKEKEVSAGNL